MKTFVTGTRWKPVIKVIMSTHKTCFCGKIRKYVELVNVIHYIEVPCNKLKLVDEKSDFFYFANWSLAFPLNLLISHMKI